MNEVIDTSPNTDVQPAEYARLLGYPRGRELSDRALELAAWARDWYARHGRPWIYARQADRVEVGDRQVSFNGTTFTSKRLQSAFSKTEAERAVLVAVSAGEELEREAQRLWQEEKPDEYFFLEVYGSAVVEHLITMHGARLCAWAESQSLAVLPHASPGYPEWDIAQQSQLFALIRGNNGRRLPGRIEVLASGMLRPKKSLLAVFGLTSHTAHVTRLTDLNPCESCSFQPCQYRRTPYRRVPQSSTTTVLAQMNQALAQILPVAAPLNRYAKYTTSSKALARWSADRLTLSRHDDDTTDALFHFEGTTCNNMGRRLLFDYRAKLGPRSEGYRLLAQSCEPAPGDDGYKSMCRYIDAPQATMSAIEQEKPLLGRRLDDVLTWQTPTSAAGCYCELADRMHKWRLVLETIHFALVQQETRDERISPALATLS